MAASSEINSFLRDAVVVLGSGAAVVAVSRRLRVPSVVGFLLAGLLIGSAGLVERGQVELLAEIGVLFLLFTIGLELSPDRLRRLRHIVLVGGSLQLLVTAFLVCALAVVFGNALPRAVFFGFVVALSSTAVVLKLLADRRELDAPQGRVALGILLFQDLLVVPMMVLVPVLAGEGAASPLEVAGLLTLGLAAVAVVFLLARYLVPRLLEALAGSGVREIFVLAALALCLGMALLTAQLELSSALGAFLAGVLVSESDLAAQVHADMVPLRDVFTSVFFVSMGMLVDLSAALAHLPLVLGLALGAVWLKSLATFGAVRAAGFPSRIAWIAAFSLAQVGEFSFLLLELGRGSALISEEIFQILLAASVLTMMATPALIAVAPPLARRLARTATTGEGLERLAEDGSDGPNSDELSAAGGPGSRSHVIVVGWGDIGRLVGRVLAAAGVPFEAVDLDRRAVRRAQERDQPVIWGDAARAEILEELGVHRARTAVLALDDDDTQRRIVALLRRLNPRLRIIARTRQAEAVEPLHRAGADDVVAESLETAIEIFTHVLEHYHVPRHVVRAQTRVLRSERYEALRSPVPGHGVSERVLAALAAGTTDLFQVAASHRAAGASLAELDLRRATGASVIAAVRGEVHHPSPASDFRLEAGDVLVLVGGHVEVERAFRLLEGKARTDDGAPTEEADAPPETP